MCCVAVKRQKLAKSQDIKNKAIKKQKSEEPPPLVALEKLKFDNTEIVSNKMLGIKPTANTVKHERYLQYPYHSQVLYQTALSRVANEQAECVRPHDQDLNEMIQLRFY